MSQAAGAPICAVLSLRVALTRPSSQIFDSPSLSLGAVDFAADAAGATEVHSSRACFFAARTDVTLMAGSDRTFFVPVGGAVRADGAAEER
ncbi:hypothetical protein ACF1BU_23995 [Streptomyces sp. NPDC014724]|uniref:hypothetical protein n=1 Tax=unclassified Streptomyces TaxID=2593676 RepID=UPI003700BF56